MKTLSTLTKKQRHALCDAQVLNYMNEAFDNLEEFPEYPFKAIESLQSARAILEFEYLAGDISRGEYLIDNYLYDLILNISRQEGETK